MPTATPNRPHPPTAHRHVPAPERRSWRPHRVASLFAAACLATLGCRADGQALVSADSARGEGAEGSAGTAMEVWRKFNADEAATVGFPQFPSLSPDGETIVFSWAGDLWSVAATGGVAVRLTAHPAEERRSAFSPDGSMLAFESERDGPQNLYVSPILPTTGGGLLIGPVQRITVSDTDQHLGGFSADGTEVLFAGSHEPSVYRSARLYRVAVVPGASAPGPVSRLTDAFGNLPRMGRRGEVIVTRGRLDFTRPIYRGSGNMDLWRIDPDTGSFERLTTFDGTDGDGWPLPDGSVVFVSSRDGQNNVWKLAPGATDQGGGLKQLTRFKPDKPATEDGRASLGHGVRDLTVSADGRWAAFVVWDTLYRLDLTDPAAEPQPVRILAGADAAALSTQRINLDREVTEAALSPDGKTIAVVARGEVFVRSTEEGRPTRRVTATVGRERHLAWSPDGRVLYFASDESGRYGIYRATVALSREDITAEPPAATSEQKEEQAEPTNTPATPESAGSDAQPESGARGDAAPKAAETRSARKPDAKKIDHGKRWAESLRFTVEPLLVSGADERRPLPSPDGKRLLFTRGLGTLCVLELESMQQRVLLEGWNEPEALWMPDSRHIIFAREDLDFNSDIWLLDAPADTDAPLAPPINLTRHPDDDTAPRLSADGKVLVFLSDRAGENGQYDVWTLALDRRLDGLAPYELAQYYKEAADAAKKRKPLSAEQDKRREPAKKSEEKAGGADDKDGKEGSSPIKSEAGSPLVLDVEDAYLRVRRLTSYSGSEGNLAILPGGDRIIFSAEIDGRRSLVSVDHKGEDRKVIESAGVGNVSVSLTGDKVVFVRSGQAATASPTGGRTETLGIEAPVVIDVPAQQRQKFLEAARTIGDRFYHPTLKGLDWAGLTERYMSLAMRTRTPEEFNRVLVMLFGELNGSHLGARGGGGRGAPGPAIGYLGIDAEAVPAAAAGGRPGYRVMRVLPHGPADRKSSRLEEGDVIVAVDGSPLGEPGADAPARDLAAALAGRAGRETLLEVVRPAGDGAAPSSRYVLITPIGSADHGTLRYRDEVERRRRLVDELSGGRLGYLHIRGMSEPSVRDFERDLFAAGEGKDGLIIDVRDNGGGWTADILLASLTAPRHARTVPRGADPNAVPPDAYPRDRRLIYAWTRPINVLINENSFSNAEIFAHAIKTTGRGRLVGTPTYGGVISTGSFTLIDGTTVRLPFRGWYLPDGTDMENNGAQPDVPVPQTPADEIAGRDAQLEAAVKDLLEQLR